MRRNHNTTAPAKSVNTNATMSAAEKKLMIASISKSPARRSCCCCCLPPRRFWLAATELAPLWSQGGVEEERFLRLHRRGGRPAARQTMILAMTRKRRTMIPDGAVDEVPSGRGLAQARWTIKRGFQLGLVDGMTGDRPVSTDHARCALEHLLQGPPYLNFQKKKLKVIVDHDGGKSEAPVVLYISKFSRPSAQVHKLPPAGRSPGVHLST